MNKFIFGLLLSVGMSGMAMANDVTPNEDITITTTCYEQTIVLFQNECGEFTGSDASPKTFVECAEGQLEGSTTTYYWIFVRNTNTGMGCTE